MQKTNVWICAPAQLSIFRRPWTCYQKVWIMKKYESVFGLVKSTNARTITPGNKSPMFGWNQDGGNNYKC